MLNDLYPSRSICETFLLARKDPVIWHEESAPSGVDPIKASQFASQGFLLFENLLSEAEIDALREHYSAMRDLMTEQQDPRIVREPKSSVVRSIFAPHLDDRVSRQMLRHPKIVPWVKYLLGGEVYVHQARVNFKDRFDGHAFNWHSDFETWHCEDGMPQMRALSCLIMLHDNTEFNGPLMVIPGSHLQYVACSGLTPDENYRTSLRLQTVGVPSNELITTLATLNGGLQSIKGPAGSVLLFDCNLLHGSANNMSPYPRSNLFVVYNSIHNHLQAPFGGTRPRPEHIAHRKNIFVT